MHLIVRASNDLDLVTDGGDGIEGPSSLGKGGVSISNGAFMRCTASRMVGQTYLRPKRIGGPRVGGVPLELVVLRSKRVSTSFLPKPTATVTLGSKRATLLGAERVKLHYAKVIFSRGTVARGSRRVEQFVANCGLNIGCLRAHPRGR